MKVERIDVFDFKLVFTAEDFDSLKVLSINFNKQPEDIIRSIVRSGISKECFLIKAKESNNVVDRENEGVRRG